MTEESSDSQYYSENYKTSELETLKDTLNNHDIEWSEVVDEKECSSASSSCFLASISECYDESNGIDHNSVDAGKKGVNILKESKTEEAKKRLKIASKLLDEGQITLTRFLQMLEPTGE